jgi:hypothetical protein
MPTRPVPRPRRVAALAILATLLAAALPAASSAAPAPHWVLSNERSVPLEWFQGLTHQPAAGGLGSRFFVGVFVGVTRTNAALAQQARNGNVLPPDVAAAGFNHIGDPSWLPALGGRLLLPLECYTPGGPNGGNTCGRGAFGLLDPSTLQWRGLVRLDPADIPKAMWAEVSPDGRLVWTSARDDLLAYRVADVLAAVDATTAIRPVRRLVGAVPPSGVTGATFRGRRLLLSGQAAGNGPLQAWSIDVDGTGSGRLEVQLPVVAESEGLDLVPSGDGLLHWLLSPFASGPPTYGTGHSEVVSFVPRAAARLHVLAFRTAAGEVAARVTLRLQGRGHPVQGAAVSVGGTTATTPADGVVHLRPSPAVLAGRLVVTASKAALRPGRRVLPPA